MKTKRFSFAVIIAMVVALLTTAAIARNESASKAVKKRNDLTGTWLVNISCSCEGSSANSELARKLPQLTQMPSAETTQAVSQAPFNATFSFHSDGTFAEDSLIDLLPPQSPPGRGLWARTGEGEFAVTHYGVIIGSVSDPQFQGTYKVRQRLMTNETGDQFSSVARVEIFDPTGNLIFAVDSTAQGKRASVEPLP